ncbi:MAG: STAS domain-containing protein [Chloroflexi bacterium]|nr:STAS domain-containing protein [Chloroflexota bacterium]
MEQRDRGQNAAAGNSPAQPRQASSRTREARQVVADLVEQFQREKDELRAEWAKRVLDDNLLTALSRDETENETRAIYDQYLDALKTGDLSGVQAYSQNLSERLIPRGVDIKEAMGLVLHLRDVLTRATRVSHVGSVELLEDHIGALVAAVNEITITVAVGFVQERERVIREQQEAIRELSTPVLQVRERLLILPIIGVIDSQRARQITEQLLRAIRVNRARVVVIDITGVAMMDSYVANHLVQTVDACRLLGAVVIVTGISPEIAQTLVNIGVDFGRLHTLGDLQEGIEEAERLLGYKVTSSGDMVFPEDETSETTGQ